MTKAKCLPGTVAVYVQRDVLKEYLRSNIDQNTVGIYIEVLRPDPEEGLALVGATMLYPESVTRGVYDHYMGELDKIAQEARQQAESSETPLPDTNGFRLDFLSQQLAEVTNALSVAKTSEITDLQTKKDLVGGLLIRFLNKDNPVDIFDIETERRVDTKHAHLYVISMILTRSGNPKEAIVTTCGFAPTIGEPS